MITREYPNCENDFLKFQVGLMEVRAMRVPTFNSVVAPNQPTGERETDTMVPIFHLLGYGSTKIKAEIMAARKRLFE